MRTHYENEARAERGASAGPRLLAVALLFSALWACKSEPSTATSNPGAATVAPGTTQSVGLPTAGASASLSAVPVAAPSISDAEVRALVSNWTLTQNAVDFTHYAELYADRFTGIKRVGNKKPTSFDRDSWLEDRKTMFKPGLTVRADDVQVNLAGNSARVRFKQIFATDRFADEGPKELLLIATASGLRIAREEMLESTLSGISKGDVAAGALFVGSGRVYLNGAVPQAALRGPLRRLPTQTGGVHVVEQDLDPAALPESVRAWIGKPLEVYSAAGVACTTSIVALRARAEVVPHFGTVQYWEGWTPPGESPRPKAPEQEIAEGIWGMGAMDGYTLVGTLQDPCPAALWAAPTYTKPSAFAPDTPSAEVLDLLQKELRRLPEAVEIQRVFATSDAVRAKQDWLKEAKKSFVVFAPIRGIQTAVASVRVGEGCGDIEESLTVVFELDVRTAARVIRKRKLEGWGLMEARSALDLDGDGQLELLFGPNVLTEQITYWTPKQGAYEEKVLRRVGFYDCPC